MDQIRLTTEADLLLCVMYNAYKARRKDGLSRENARYFGSSKRIQEELLPQMSIDDIDDAARELDKKGLFQCQYADNTVYDHAEITTDGVIYMEHQFSDGVDRLLKRIGDLRKVILG